MADEIVTTEAGAGTEPEAAPGELRGCPYCGTLMDGRAHRCTACGGHTGISWGTVHKEHWLFVLSAILIGIGCLASWNGRSPSGVVGPPMTGLDTIRGTLMLALAVYALIAGVFNILYRRMVLWPFVLNAFLALWVGLGGFASAYGGKVWKEWDAASEGGTLLDKFLGNVRAVPPGFLLLALAGVLVFFKLLAGILSAAGKGKAKAAPPPRRSATRRRIEETGAAPTDAGEPPPVV